MRARAGAYGGGDQALESTRGCGVFGPGVQPVGKLGKVPELRTSTSFWCETPIDKGKTPFGAVGLRVPAVLLRRGRLRSMIVDRYKPMNLFEIVPKLNLQMEPELVQLDKLLDDDELFSLSLVKADLIQRYPNSGRLGRHSTPVEVISRMLWWSRSFTASATSKPSVSSPIR
jgi:hypothetical protein